MWGEGERDERERLGGRRAAIDSDMAVEVTVMVLSL